MRIVSAGSILVLNLFFASLAASASPQISTISQIALGKASGAPGTSVAVPINFRPGQALRIRRLKLTVKFRSAHLAFEKVERSPAPEMQSAQVYLEDEVTSGQEETQVTTLTVVVSTVPNALVSSESAQGDLAEGMLGAMSFRISDESDGQVIDLDLSAEATEVGANEPLPSGKIYATDGAVWVLAPGTMGCFFFTH